MTAAKHVTSIIRLEKPVMYRALCECGWFGSSRWKRADAQNERRDHDERVTA